MESTAESSQFVGAELAEVRDAGSSRVSPPLHERSVGSWSGEYDLIVVGFGLAGASAALEAAGRGQQVLLLDRFQGGGSSQMSGGIVYAGGGTHVQHECGVADAVEGMADYLRLEVGGLVSDDTVRRFCEDSLETLAFLEQHGVNFSGPVAPKKTSYPADQYYLYYSDNSTVPAYIGKHPPAERGHRTKSPDKVPGAIPIEGKKPHGGFSEGADVGWYLMASIKQAVARNQGITVMRQTRASRLIVDDNGVCGVEGMVLGGAAAKLHRWAEGVANKLTLQIMGLHKPFAAIFRSAEGSASPRAFRAKNGVVLAAGGFIRNSAMMERHAPRYMKTLPIGSFGDDGAGIRLGCSVGAVAGYLDRISAWRFINPPYDWTKGLIIGASGDRITNEEQYGAHLSRAIYEVSDGRAWLVVDQTIWDTALAEVSTGDLFAFQQFPVKQAQKGAKSAATIADLAGLLGVPAGPMQRAVAAYNAAARSGSPDPMGKSAGCCQAFGEGPFYAISLTHALPVSPITSLTTGGLRVSERTGNVLDMDGNDIVGLYAAGRTAIGIPSNNYVSGLSLADCVWSGRRAARAAG
jgi:3-oxo-5alpha-steroid 4-dehydrogenase